MRYLATGAGGFIGRYVFEELERVGKPGDIIIGVNRKSDSYEKYDVLYSKHIGCDLNDIDETRRLLIGFAPDVIFHFAGCPTVSSPPDKIWSANVDTTFNLLQHAPKECRFILASSINAEKLTTVYAASKRSAENLVESYTNQGLVKGTSVRLCAVAGAYNSHGVVKAVVDKFMDKSTDKVELFTNSSKPFTYVCDVAKKVVGLVNNDNPLIYRQPVLDLVPGDNIYVSTIANIIKILVNNNKEFVFTNESWSGDEQEVNYMPNKASLNVFGRMNSSKVAVADAIHDILKLEYGFSI